MRAVPARLGLPAARLSRQTGCRAPLASACDNGTTRAREAAPAAPSPAPLSELTTKRLKESVEALDNDEGAGSG